MPDFTGVGAFNIFSVFAPLYVVETVKLLLSFSSSSVIISAVFSATAGVVTYAVPI